MLNLFCSIFIIFSTAVKTFLSADVKICREDYRNGSFICKLQCPSGKFSLPGMSSCHPWLKCDAEITLISLISVSVVKTVYLADWKGYPVAFSVLSSEKYEEDFFHNLFMIKSLSPHEDVVQLLGYCDNSLVTEYHELGSALNIQYLLENSLKIHNNVRTRLNLCISYASVIKFLHNSPLGIRVMCDSNTVEKTLSQYLLTIDLKLVVNDLDATPLVDNATEGIICGKKEVTGELIAPEQVWPYKGKEFNINEMPPYDEKTDIFKIPDICNWFLGDDSDADVVKYKVFHIHQQCKNINPLKRPTADIVIRTYENILNDLT